MLACEKRLKHLRQRVGRCLVSSSQLLVSMCPGLQDKRADLRPGRWLKIPNFGALSQLLHRAVRHVDDARTRFAAGRKLATVTAQYVRRTGQS